MARVQIPVQLAKLTTGLREVEAAGETLFAVIESLDRKFPGLKARLVEDDRLRPGMAAAVDNVIASGLRHPVGGSSEVVFLPALRGGRY